MPFSEEFDGPWQSTIRPAIEEDQNPSLSAHRVDARVLAGSVITEILEGIARVRLVLADISITSEGEWSGQRNGNVMYEVGLAHALRQATEVVLVRSDREEISFDVSGIKTYDYDKTDLPGSRQRLASVVKGHLHQIEEFKSLKVELAIRSLDGECLKLLNAYAASSHFADPQASFQAQEAVFVPIKMASAKLLELGITYCDYNHRNASYAYHWTDFGRAVMGKLGIIEGTTDQSHAPDVAPPRQ